MTRIINILAAQNVKDSFYRQPIEFYLTHIVLKYPTIFKKARKGFNYKILDCSACELGEGVNMREVIKAAKIIDATEIVLPDKVRSNKSLELSLKALKSLSSRELEKYKIAIVIQGVTVVDAKCMIRELSNREEREFIHTIMIPKWFSTKNRIWLTEVVREYLPEKKIHWLGLGDDIGYCINSAKKLKIRTLDTGYFISIGQKNLLNVTKNIRDMKHKINLEANNLSDEDISIICNITNTYRYDGSNNKYVEIAKDRQFTKTYNKIVIILLTIILSSLICYLFCHFIG